MRPEKRANQGFTLVELITVMTLLGILSAVLAPFITSATRSYEATKGRSELIAKGRLALERIAREVRLAVPNSIEVIGQGIQFLPVRESARLVLPADDFGAVFNRSELRFETAARTGLYLLSDDLSFETNDQLIIGATSATTIKNSTTRVALTNISATTIADDGLDNARIASFTSHTFPLETPSNQAFISNGSYEIGLIGDTLYWHSSADSSAYDSDADWSISDPVLIDGVTSVSFIYEPDSSSGGEVLWIELQLSEGQQEIVLNQEIHVRNSS